MSKVYSILAELPDELLQFDLSCTESAGSVLTADLTEYPIENGEFVSDNVIVKPRRVSMEGMITDVQGFFQINEEEEEVTYYNNNTREFINRLQSLMLVKQPFTVQLGYNIFNNMFLTSCGESQTKDLGFHNEQTQAYAISLTFQQTRFATRAKTAVLTDDELAAIATERRAGVSAKEAVREEEEERKKQQMRNYGSSPFGTIGGFSPIGR